MKKLYYGFLYPSNPNTNIRPERNNRTGKLSIVGCLMVFKTIEELHNWLKKEHFIGEWAYGRGGHGAGIRKQLTKKQARQHRLGRSLHEFSTDIEFILDNYQDQIKNNAISN